MIALLQVLLKQSCCASEDDVIAETVDIYNSAAKSVPLNVHAPTLPDVDVDLEQREKQMVQAGFTPKSLAGGKTTIFDIRMYEDELQRDMLERYYKVCLESKHLMVTFSCFSHWSSKKKVNCGAKVIPAVRVKQPKPVRVFFFDDNLDMDGKEDSAGICNLRDVETGEFVDFSTGSNGFRMESCGAHTVVKLSNQYSNILVRANILDAIEDENYFHRIIKRYLQPGERAIVYMDVNSTAICIDTVSGKETANILLSTMFEFIEIKPTKPFDLAWESCSPLKVEKPTTFKALVKKLFGKDLESYRGFYCFETCVRFLTEMTNFGEIVWASVGTNLSLQGFKSAFEAYLKTMHTSCMEDGIVKSWFKCYEACASGNHTIILNSFGVDPYKLVKETLGSADKAAKVLQVTINYDDWEGRDKKKFDEQFHD